MKRREFINHCAELAGLTAANSLIPRFANAQFNAGAAWKRNRYWHAISATGAPSARYDAAYVWTGTQLLIWGGRVPGSNTILGDGFVYTLATNTWTTMSTTNAPSVRLGHSAVWDGTYMIVWGGATASNLHTALSDGAMYNPALNTWTTMAGTPPSSRCYPGAVYTGSDMLVWGGYDWATSDKNDGFKFNSGTNTWSAAIQTTNAPVARDTFMMCRAGGNIVVFGGENYSAAALNSGAIYNVAGNSWTTISSTGVPSARECWRNYAYNGSQIFLFGGDDVTNALDGGYLFDPVTNSWTTVSSTGAPSARTYHAVVWNGVQFMVWGGANKTKTATAGYNDGFYYDPVGDKWWPMNTGGTLSVRNDTAFVWTGSEFLILGGQNQGMTGGYTDGARYY